MHIFQAKIAPYKRYFHLACFLHLNPSMRLCLIPIFCIALILGGCQAPGPVTETTIHRSWATQYGGILRGPRQYRLSQTCKRLAARLNGLHLKPYVLNSTELAAYSWPNGELFVTQGLMDATAPDELAAVIAHEAGHLIAQNTPQPTAMLRGQKHRSGAEIRADQLGCRILEDCGISPIAMLRMLQKVQQATAPKDPSYGLLCDRVKLLEDH